MKKIFLLILLMQLALCMHAQNKFLTDSLDNYIAREMQRWNIPGVAVSVVHKGKIIFMKGFGVRDINSSQKVDENTLFQIASNTKAYTGTALAMLEEQKRLSLNDKITKYFPDFKLFDELATREVTIRDMLCHRIGFRTFQSDLLNWDCNLSRKELIQNMRNVEPVYSFRSRYGYCNACFLTAGEIIPVVTDTSWDDFLKYNFFIPLGMKRTSTDQATILNDKNSAKPYTIFDGRLTALHYADINALAPAASINSCVKDISNWILMQLDSGRFGGKEIIPFAAIQKTRSSSMVVRDQQNPEFKSKHFYTYGLGWFLEDYEGRKIISHDGGANGFVTNTTLIPEENFGFTILTNTDANNFYGALQQQLTDAILNVPYKNRSAESFQEFQVYNSRQDSIVRDLLQKSTGKKPALALDEYAGKFSNPVYGTIEIKNVSGRLMIYFSHHPKLNGRLMSLGENNFLCAYSDVTYGVKETPFEVKDGKVVSITIKVNDFVDYMPYVFAKSE